MRRVQGLQALGILLFALLPACATRVSPGEGSTGPATFERQKAAPHAALLTSTETACRVAGERPDDVRMQRKAASLATMSLKAGTDAEKAAIAGWVKPVLARIDASPEACAMLHDAGDTHEALQDDEAAAARFTRSARECKHARDAVAASWPLERLKRCPEVVALVRESWPHAAEGERIPLLDAVKGCSDTLSLRTNLAFVDDDTLSAYVALLKARAREEEEQRRRAQEREDMRNLCQATCFPGDFGCTTRCTSNVY